MTDGLLLVDKPAGPTSHDVVDVVRRVYDTRRVGHTGTLDPFATGLLLVLLGRATRLARFLAGEDKTYEGEMVLGVRTETDDATGAVVSDVGPVDDVTDDAIAAAAGRLVGHHSQRPPAYSAKKIQGERSYRRARRGEVVELEARPVQVYEFAIVARAGSRIRFRARVSAGTYVRSLARDVGEQLSRGAHLAELRRTAVGHFTLADATPLADLEREPVTPRPALDAVRHLPMIALDRVTRDAVTHGRPITLEQPAAGPVALVSAGELVAVAEPFGAILKPRVVVAS